jgi:hypothetical protein
MTTFNNTFHGPNYGTINQAGRDMHIDTVGALDALAAATKLRREIERLELTADDRTAANAEIAAVERELRRPEPDPGAVAAGLERATRILRSAGAFASAGVAIAGPIGVIAGILGPLGQVIADAVRN